MLFTSSPDPPQVRLRCRTPQCAGLLAVPADNPRDAFCCRGCEKRYYDRRCRVCENLFTRKTSRRQVCTRTKCRYAFKTHSERFFGSRYPSSPNAHTGAESAHSTGLKTGTKSGQGWRIVAGPTDIHPINLRSFPADIAAARTGRPGPVLITRTTPPVNVIGGYRFPGAPAIDLRPTHKLPEPAIGDDQEQGK